MEINTPVTVAVAIIALWIGFHINRKVSFLHT
jgi:Na+/glutamate symporter